MTFHYFKLRFHSALHLAKGKSDYDEGERTLHSDTLQAALFACALQLGASEREAYAMMQNTRVSSAYPFFGDEFFFPKPYARIQPIAGESEDKQAKPLKKVKFLGKSFFEDFCTGNSQKSISRSKHLLSGGQFVSDHPDLSAALQAGRKTLAAEKVAIIRSEVNQRVTIPPDYCTDATPYYTDRMFFHEQAGLYFLAQFEGGKPQTLFEQALCLLADNGIGTDRSVGNGSFECIERGQLSLQLPDNANAQLNLSLYCPERTELTEALLDQSSYQIVKRGGYLASAEDVDNITLRKRSVYMFEEGSVFPETNLTGKIVDLKPTITDVQHEVWRDGRGFFIPVTMKQL